LPDPMVPGDLAGPKEPGERIDSVENQGEFPARLTDQGDLQAAPRRRTRRM
jgi:hypothetical protein